MCYNDHGFHIPINKEILYIVLVSFIVVNLVNHYCFSLSSGENGDPRQLFPDKSSILNFISNFNSARDILDKIRKYKSAIKGFNLASKFQLYFSLMK